MDSSIVNQNVQARHGLPREPAKDRFWRFVDKTKDCWEWQRCVDASGYGGFHIASKGYPTHRFSWMLHFGDIPEGMLVCHHCDNPPCVNPDHLFLGTKKDNYDDMVAKGRAGYLCGEDVYCAKLTEQDVLEIRRLHTLKGMTDIKISKRFAVGRKSINNVIIRRTWKHI